VEAALQKSLEKLEKGELGTFLHRKSSEKSTYSQQQAEKEKSEGKDLFIKVYVTVIRIDENTVVRERGTSHNDSREVTDRTRIKSFKANGTTLYVNH